MNKETKMAQEIIGNVGGVENIQTVLHCMTRLRLSLFDESKIKIEQVQAIDGVMGVIQDDTLQIVVGPGTVNKVAAEIDRMMKDTEPIMKEKIAATNNTPFTLFLRKIGNVFIPLIPGLIASGIINGMVQLLQIIGYGEGTNWFAILTLFGHVLLSYIAIVVGWSAAKEWDGTPVLGAMVGGVLFSPLLADITIYSKELVPGESGLLGVLLAVYLATIIEKQCRKFIPNSVDLIFTPFLTIMIVGLLALFVIVPVAGIVSKGMTTGIVLLLESAPIFTGALLSGFYMVIVMAGLHHSFTFLHVELIQVFGVTGILPILAMSGAGQVGAALAVYVKTKNTRLKTLIRNAVPVGFLGVGEPLLYGVTLPLGRPFMTASIGSAVGGAFQAWIGTAANGIGLSGLPLVLLIGEGKYLFYLFGILLAYFSSFVCTYLFGFNDAMAKDIK